METDWKKKYEDAMARMELCERTGLEKKPDYIFPELRESEDDRIRKALIDGVRQIRCKNGITQEQMLAYLEKQKDLDKMIVVSPEVWDNDINDAYKNGKKDGEKQKEQKFTEKQDYSDLTDLERAIHRGFLVVGVENVPVTIIKETAQDCLAWMKPQKGANGNEKKIPNKQKPAEWSEDMPDEYYNGELSTFEGLLYTEISMFVSEYEKDKNTNLIQFVKESSIDLLKAAKKGENLMTWMAIDKNSAVSTLKQTAECLNSKNLWPGLQSSLLDLAKDIDAIRSQSTEWSEEDEENRQIINEIVWESIGKNIESIEDGFVITQGTAVKLIKWLNSLPESFSLQPHQQDETQVDKMLCSQVWWEEQGWIMIPPDATIEGIDSLLRQVKKKLQQEQPETSNNLVDVDAVREDFMMEVYRVLDADPTNDRANAIIDAFDSLPTVSQQPEVDIKKELHAYICSDEYMNAREDGSLLIARHFYELGRNARKEESK